MSTTTLVGTPDPHDPHEGRVLRFPAHEPLTDAVPADAVVTDAVVTGGMVVDAVPAPGPGTAVEPAGEVVDGVLVEESTDPTSRPLPDILPPWLATPDRALATARWAGRYAARYSGHHAVRSPLYGARVAWWITRGGVIGLARIGHWLTAREYAPVMAAAQEKGVWQDYLAALTLKKETAHHRRRVAMLCTLAAGTVLTIADLMVGSWTLWLVAGGAAAVAWRLGRPADAPALLATPAMPIQLELSPAMLTDALRAAGLVKSDATPQLVTPVLRDGHGWAVTFDLPRGGGKTAADVLAKRTALAAELGVDEIQVIMGRVRAAAGGHAGRLALWVADDDPYLGTPNPSPLAAAGEFSVWNPIPFGQNARGGRIEITLMWQSMFFGGLPRRGKTFAQRLPSAAGVLDPLVRHYVADGKGGADWMPMRAVAHRLVIGAEDEAIERFIAMLDELIAEMGRRFAVLGGLPTSVCPEGKLTPEISKRYDMPVIFITIDELQEYLDAMDSKLKDEVVDKLARLARRAPAAGFILNAASQRPDADSVPAKLREIITYRYCTQVVDRTSSDMVLGKGKAAMGADASILEEYHKGVGVLVTGPGSFEVLRCDYMDIPTFTEVCQRGRAMREAAGTLTGDAASDRVAAAEAAGITIPPILADVLYVMHGVDRMHTTTILSRLSNMDDDRYADWTAETLAAELERAGVQRTGKQVKVEGQNLAGYRRADLEAAVPAGATLPTHTARPGTVTDAIPDDEPGTDGDR